MTDSEFPTGWIPDEFDARDRPFYMVASEAAPPRSGPQNQASSTSSSAAPTPLPSALPPASTTGTGNMVTLPVQCPPVYDQSPFQSCTANAVTAALRYAYVKAYGVTYDTFDPSRLFIYLNGRRYGATYGEVKPQDVNTFKDPVYAIRNDIGASIRKTIDAVNMMGACDEKYYRYPELNDKGEATNWTDEKGKSQKWTKELLYEAPVDCFFNARTYIPRVINYYRIVQPEAWHRVMDPQATIIERQRATQPPPISELQRCIDEGYPFIFAFYFYPSANFFNADHFDADGVFKAPPKTAENDLGGHTVLAIGYDSSNGRFLIQNSWGTTKWPKANLKDAKMKGYCWMPYEWFEPATWKGPTGLPVYCSNDFWVIKTPAGFPIDKSAPRQRAGGEPVIPPGVSKP